jgi:hypothetical protein
MPATAPGPLAPQDLLLTDSRCTHESPQAHHTVKINLDFTSKGPKTTPTNAVAARYFDVPNPGQFPRQTELSMSLSTQYF